MEISLFLLTSSLPTTRLNKKSSMHAVMNRDSKFSDKDDISQRRLLTNDVIIVGAGVAGSALAHTLGKDGRRVLVIERNLKEPKTFTGELLQPAGYLKLRELGLDDCVRDIDAQLSLGYTLFKDGKTVKLHYPLENYDSDVAGRTFHHGRFVQKLREKASSLSNVTIEEGTATSLIEEEGRVKGIKYKAAAHGGGEEILTANARLTFLCDGRFSRLSKFISKPEIDKPSHFAGFILENSQLRQQKYPLVALANPCAVLFYPISNTEVRCLIDFPGPKLPFGSNAELADFLKSVMAPQMPPELREAFVSSVERGNIKAMPVSCMPAKPRVVPGAILLGDALNMRHSITGGGMSVALHDIALLSGLLGPSLDLEDTAKITRIAAKFYDLRKPAAFTINVLADALYKVILGCTGETRDQILQANFNYMSFESKFTKTLPGLIAGLSCNPWNIVLHFLGMAAFTAGNLTMPVPTPIRVLRAASFLRGAVALVVPLLWKEGLRQVFFAERETTI